MTKDELLSCLIDRPCEACKFHTELGCSSWSCVFEGKVEDAEPHRIIEKIKQAEPFNNEDCPQWVIDIIRGNKTDGRIKTVQDL